MSTLDKLQAEARRQHPEESDAEIWSRVAYRAVTLKTGTTVKWVVLGKALKILWAILVLLLLGAIAAKAQETYNPSQGYRFSERGVRLLEAPAFDAPIIFLSNAGTQLAVIPAGKVILNCSTNMSCSWNSATRQFDMSSSATAGTAFSALTASLNTNAGTFSASGNTWDFTAATLFKLRTGAGLTTSANGDIGQNSTDGRWHFWFNGADRLVPAATNTGVPGQVPISNGDGTYSNADPLITYNQALLLNGVAATGAQTSAAVALATRMAVGTLNVAGSGITGAPAGCTIAYRLSLGGVNTADIESFAFTPGNNYQNFATTPSAANSSADLMLAAYSCTTFPTAGTITVSFSPLHSQNFLTGDTNSFLRSLRVNLQSQTVNANIDGQTNVATIAPDGGGGSRLPIFAPFTFNGTNWDRQRSVVNGQDSTGTGISASGILGQFDDTAPGAVTENNFAPVRITSSRGVHANLRNAAGTELGTAGAPLRVDPTGTTTQPVSLAAAVDVSDRAARLLGQVEGRAASGAAKAGNPNQIGCVFNTTPSTVTTGQAVELGCTNRGEAFIAKGPSGFSIDNTSFAATQSGVWTVQPGNTANTTAWLVQGSFANNGAAAGTDRANVNPGIARSDYAGGTAFTAGRNAAPDVGTDGLLHVAALPAIRPASYSASATVASAASATDISVLPGNATNILLVTSVRVSCTQTTAGIITLNIILRSTADTAGTSVAMTEIPDDSTFAASSSAALTYTANPTTGTAVGNIDTVKLGCMAAGTATPNDIYILNRRQKPIVLRGTAQQLAINLGGATVTGGSFAITYEWMEITTISP